MGESICNLRFSLQALFSRVWEGEWETGLDRFVDAPEVAQVLRGSSFVRVVGIGLTDG